MIARDRSPGARVIARGTCVAEANEASFQDQRGELPRAGALIFLCDHPCVSPLLAFQPSLPPLFASLMRHGSLCRSISR